MVGPYAPGRRPFRSSLGGDPAQPPALAARLVHHTLVLEDRAGDGILELHHAAALGVIAGANMLLTDVHPDPQAALCDGPQALTLPALDHFLDDMSIVRKAYEERVKLQRLRDMAERMAS